MENQETTLEAAQAEVLADSTVTLLLAAAFGAAVGAAVKMVGADLATFLQALGVASGALLAILAALIPWDRKRRRRDVALYSEALLRDERAKQVRAVQEGLVSWKAAHREVWNPQSTFERLLVDLDAAIVTPSGINITLRIVSACPERHVIELTKGRIVIPDACGEEITIGYLQPVRKTFDGHSPALYIKEAFHAPDFVNGVPSLYVTLLCNLEVRLEGETPYSGPEKADRRWVRVGS